MAESKKQRAHRKDKETNRLLSGLSSPDPAKALTVAYILALSVIAVLTISVHAITAHIAEQQKDSAEIAYHIGRQRTLMQQIVLYATNYFRIGEPLDYDFMMQSVWELEKGHEFLVKTIDEKDNSPALERIYHRPPFNLDDQVKDFNAIVKDFSEYPANGQSVDDYSEKREELINKLNYKSTNILRPAMDVALESFQTETLEKMARFYGIQLGGALFILIVLLGEAVFIFRPLITKIREYNIVMKRYALEDSLTGLNNRRAFMNAAMIELKKASREKTAVTVALLDLDHFKNVNDTYGHEVGDRVLQHFATILKKSFRAGDIVGRIGGEEFAILLPKIDHKGATLILQRLCDTVAQTPCDYVGPGGVESALSYTISIGFTGPLSVTDQTIDQLLSHADEGLYAAKEQGRNRIVHIG